MRSDDHLLVWAIIFVGTAFVLGIMALLLIGPTSPVYSREADVPLSWVLAFVLLLIGPPIGTLIAIIWPGGGGGGR